MRLNLYSLAFLLCALSVSGQELKRTTHLIVRFGENSDWRKNRSYYYISAETGNPNASAIYGLIHYKPERYSVNTGSTFFSPENDTASNYYNYFITPTAAMEFLSRRGWQLLTVISEVTSDYGYPGSGNQPITTVSSRPVYYFRKELQ